MTNYLPSDVNNDWEFKIVRGTGRTFRKPERLHAILADEALAGWELVEKFDDSRLRLRRPTSRRQLDGKFDFDPYRTVVAGGETTVILAMLGAMALALILGLTLFLVRSAATADAAATPMAVEVTPAPRPAPAPPPEDAAVGPGIPRPASVVMPPQP